MEVLEENSDTFCSVGIFLDAARSSDITWLIKRDLLGTVTGEKTTALQQSLCQEKNQLVFLGLHFHREQGGLPACSFKCVSQRHRPKDVLTYKIRSCISRG